MSCRQIALQEAICGMLMDTPRNQPKVRQYADLPITSEIVSIFITTGMAIHAGGLPPSAVACVRAIPRAACPASGLITVACSNLAQKCFGSGENLESSC
jgi:hypothetical protein